MTPEILVYVLDYYFAFWLFNSAAYAVVSMGMKRWLKFSEGLDTEHALRIRFWTTAAFGAMRLTLGTVALVLYLASMLEPIEAIVLLGVSSLLLNTGFIMGEGILMNRQAKAAWNLPNAEQRLLRDAINQFASLGRTVRNA